MNIHQLLGDEADSLLGHTCKGISKKSLTLPGPGYIDQVMTQSDRSIAVLRNLAHMYDHGRLGGTGYLSILPVDQGVEHSAAASFARNPVYLDPSSICELAVEGGCMSTVNRNCILAANKNAYWWPSLLHTLPHKVVSGFCG